MPQPARGAVDEPLHDERRDRAPHAAIRPHGRLVGGDAQALGVIVRHAIGPGQERDDLDDLDAERPRIDRVGADVGQDPRAEPEDRPGGVHAQLGVDDLVPGLGAGQQIFAAVADPLDRPPEREGQRAHRDLLGVEHGLDAEAAAHVGRDDPDAAGRQAQHLGQALAHDPRNLRGGPERQQPGGRAMLGQAGAILHGDAGVPVEAEAIADDVGGAGQRARHIALAERAREEQVGGRRLVDERTRRLERPLEVRDHGQRRVLDVDQLQGVLGGVAALGDDHGHGFTHVADLLAGQRRELGGPVAAHP